MNLLPIVKLLSKATVAVGVGSIVGGALKHVATPSIFAHPVQLAVAKGAVTIGAVVLADMVASQASDYTEKQIDDLVKAFQDGKTEIEKADPDTAA